MRSICVISLQLIVFFAISENLWAYKPLPPPLRRTQQEYNYSNGDVGSNHSGMSAAEAGSIDEKKVPLGIPKLQSVEAQEQKTESTPLQGPTGVIAPEVVHDPDDVNHNPDLESVKDDQK